MDTSMDELRRCGWSGSDPLYHQYHDTEWGVPLRNDQRLFEYLALDMMQAGLSWFTILRKRDAFLQAFDQFKISSVANFGEQKVQDLLQDAGIVRNRAKINAIIHNAGLLLDMEKEVGGFSNYLWGFVDYQPLVNKWTTLAEIPAKTELSDRISKDMITRGFKFCGSTIIYAFIQSAGLVNDHLVSCFRYHQVGDFVRK